MTEGDGARGEAAASLNRQRQKEDRNGEERKRRKKSRGPEGKDYIIGKHLLHFATSLLLYQITTKFKQ